MFWPFHKEVKLVCFDIDNTLCDFGSAESETEAYMAEIIAKDIKKLQSKVKRKIKHSCSSVTILKIFNDIKNSHMHHDLEPEEFSRNLWFKETIEHLDNDTNLGISMNTLIKNSDMYEKKYWDYLISKAKLFPNTLSTLDSLRSKGLKLATITDSDGKREIKINRIKALGLDKYFDYVITTDDTGLNKPAIENWQHLIKISGLKSSECIMIGDHPDIDLVNAKKLGFVTVWTKEHLNMDLHHKYVDYEIKDIKEVIDIVEKINK